MRRNLLKGARVYLSGPMDFVASRASEKKYGWRNRVGDFLRRHGATVFDPWHKPPVKGRSSYGEEDEKSTEVRATWTYKGGRAGAAARSSCSGAFWETMHIDLRMVDISDFIISYCPTNIYSVGTPHEIVMARQQRKPVLFISPPVAFPALSALRERLRGDDAAAVLEQLVQEVPVKENPAGIPSLWYMPLVGSENFFDGFGFAAYRKKFKWKKTTALDVREGQKRPRRPLLPFLESLTRGELPKRWDYRKDRFMRNDDWLLLDQDLTGRKR
jgi:hypothetical protein